MIEEKNTVEESVNGALEIKKLYVSDWCKRSGYTPENGYSPLFYNVEEHETVLRDAVDEKFGNAVYMWFANNVMYTDCYDLQVWLQDECGKMPLGFDRPTVAEELKDDGYEW